MLAPVVIFVYNRPNHTRKTIEALSQNRLSDQTEVYIYSDGGKNEKAKDKVALVRDYLDTLETTHAFKMLKVIKAQKNNGLAKSVIAGVSEAMKHFGKVIVVEDDLISSPDFLEYMNGALDYYENDPRIWSISGYTFDIPIPGDYTSDVYFSYRGGSWGYATWKDRWDMVNWDVSDYAQFKRSNKLRAKLNRGGRDMANMLDMQMADKIDSWAIRWCYAQSKRDMLTVYPVVSRIRNIGIDGSGTHSGVNTKYDVSLYTGSVKCSFDGARLDKRIMRAFRNHFMSRIDYCKIELKRRLLRLIKRSR